MKKYAHCFSILVAMFMLTGCVAGGVSFVKESVVPKDKALVYFYRPNNFQGSALDVTVKDNDKTAFKIKNGQYIKYFTEPGKHKFYTDTMAIDKPTEIELEVGQAYYIKTGLSVGMWTGTWALNRVYESEALEELKSCKSGKK